MVNLVLLVEEKHKIECPTLMFWVVVNVSAGFCGVNSSVFTHQNPQQRPQTSDHFPRQTKGNIYGGFSLASWGERPHWVPNFDVAVVNRLSENNDLALLTVSAFTPVASLSILEHTLFVG
jgi:hypothetical protein